MPERIDRLKSRQESVVRLARSPQHSRVRSPPSREINPFETIGLFSLDGDLRLSAAEIASMGLRQGKRRSPVNKNAPWIGTVCRPAKNRFMV